MKVLMIVILLCIMIPSVATAQAVPISKVTGVVISYAQLGPNHLQITLRTVESGVVTRDFWVATAHMGIFKNDLEISKVNGTPVDLIYHRDWTKNPVLVLDDVINHPGVTSEITPMLEEGSEEFP